MNKQEIFDTVATHLLKQGVRSGQIERHPFDGSDVFKCKYRGPNGTKCAAGALIPDEKYDPACEGMCSDAVGYILSNFDTGERDLIMALQRIHDSYVPRDWKKTLCSLGEACNLDPSVLDTLPEIP